MTDYYNEIDRAAAAWLRQLIADGAIPAGDVDERDVRDVLPSELSGYRRCHFFAGIGIWAYALEEAWVGPDRRIWTGSCPCQPFSAAGKKRGLADERHLWPAWFWLIGECRPDVVFGEQVSSPDGLKWFDVVSSDLEGAGYAVGAIDTCAAGVGAPILSQRLYFAAEATESRWARVGGSRGAEEGKGAAECGPALAVASHVRPGRPEGRSHAGLGPATGCGESLHLDAPGRKGSGRDAGSVSCSQETGSGERLEARHLPDEPVATGPASDVGLAHVAGLEIGSLRPDERGFIRVEGAAIGAAGALHGPWADAEWLYCTDGKFRPVEPGLEPLVDGHPGRVGMLQGYGNALVAPQAVAFVKSYLGTKHEHDAG